MQLRPLFFLFTSIFVLSACATRVQTTVQSSEHASAATQPVARAKVSIFCPQVIKADSAYPIGETDDQGQLQFREPALGRWISDGCDIIVEKPGYQAKRVNVADVCVEHWATRCVRAVIAANLDPL